MRLASINATLEHAPLWPPLLATRGPGSNSALHRHHALHLIVASEGELRVQTPDHAHRAAGVLTAPDVPHAIDARGAEVLLVFLEPESEVGASLARVIDAGVRVVSDGERRALLRDADPQSIMREDGVRWTAATVATLGGELRARPTSIHPRVRRLLGQLRTLPPDTDLSLEALAASVKLSPGRLMHVFSESIGIPLRPYLAWLKLQRAAAAIAAGQTLTQAAALAGFTDAAHMTHTFRKMLGAPPSALRPSKKEAKSVT